MRDVSQPSRKSYGAAGDFARHDKVYQVILFGYVGLILAAATNATPIAIKKNEKNWPRVKGPINSASGSRKYSITIRNTAYKIKKSPVNTPLGWRVRVRTSHKIANKTIPSKNAS